MRELQTIKENPTEFATAKRVLFNNGLDQFFEFVGFACSEACRCKGECTNNALFIAEQRCYSLEIFRRDTEVGFGIRSPVMIPAGTPFLEFVGEITDKLEDSCRDYAYQLTYSNDEKWKNFVQKYQKWTPSYAALLKKLNNRTFYCNPKRYGNAGRTACHSCAANTEIIRIYQKSLSPAHSKLVMISLEDICPGVPITIHYGTGYVGEQLAKKCRCGSFACNNGKHHKQFSLLDNNSMALCLQHLNAELSKLYTAQVPQGIQRELSNNNSQNSDTVYF